MSAHGLRLGGADFSTVLANLRPSSNPDIEQAILSGAFVTKPAAYRGPLPIAEHAINALRRFRPRRRPISPDKAASKQRKMSLVLCGALPSAIGCHYTDAQLATHAVIACEVKQRGHCDLAIDAIAARAGCGRTSVQSALREAVRLGHLSVTPRPRPGQKNLTNIIRVIDKQWMSWIKRGPSRSRMTGFKAQNPTNTPEINREKKAQFEPSQEALRDEYGRKSLPPRPTAERRRPMPVTASNTDGPRQLSEAMLNSMQWIEERRNAPQEPPPRRVAKIWER